MDTKRKRETFCCKGKESVDLRPGGVCLDLGESNAITKIGAKKTKAHDTWMFVLFLFCGWKKETKVHMYVHVHVQYNAQERKGIALTKSS